MAQYDLTMLRNLSDNDAHFIKDMLQTFKRTAPPAIDRMEEYAAASKPDAAGREAHKLIPGVSFLGAKVLESLLVKVEETGKTGKNLEDLPEVIREVRRETSELIAEFEAGFELE
jgi:HPt (histidine-containing phosphotransfer) domain-containing protein